MVRMGVVRVRASACEWVYGVEPLRRGSSRRWSTWGASRRLFQPGRRLLPGQLFTAPHSPETTVLFCGLPGARGSMCGYVIRGLLQYWQGFGVDCGANSVVNCAQLCWFQPDVEHDVGLLLRYRRLAPLGWA